MNILCIITDPQGDVDKNNQWMGASVASQATDHGKAVVWI